MNFKKNQFVVKVIDVMGSRTATVATVESVKRGVVRLIDSGLNYHAESGNELDPVIPGCRSYLVHFDDGEIEKWGL